MTLNLQKSTINILTASLYKNLKVLLFGIHMKIQLVNKIFSAIRLNNSRNTAQLGKKFVPYMELEGSLFTTAHHWFLS
jgi:hypothetical protein